MAKKTVDSIFSYKFNFPKDRHLLLHNISLLYTKPLFGLTILILTLSLVISFKLLPLALSLFAVYLYTLIKMNKLKSKITFNKKFPKKTKEESKEIIEYTITNPTLNSVSNLILYDNFDGSKDKKGFTSFIEFIPFLKQRDYINLKKNIELNNGMGVKELGPTIFQLTDELGIHNLRFEDKKINTVEVYPKVHQTLAPGIKPTIEHLTFGTFDTKIRGNNVNFYCAKEYQTGDNVKHINWKLTLKANKIIINQFENNSNSDITILLIDDLRLHFGSGSNNSFEYCKDLALSLCHANITSNNSVGLISHQENIKSKTGKTHLNALELKFANLEPTEFSKQELFHRKKVSLPEVEKLKKRVRHYAKNSNELFIFTGFIDGRLWDIYFETFTFLAKTGMNIHLIIIHGFNNISKKVGVEDKAWIKKLEADTNKKLTELRNLCQKRNISLSCVDMDSNLEYSTKIKRGFTVERAQ